MTAIATITPAVDAAETGVSENAMGGLEGAQHTSRETVKWQPSYGSPDQIVNQVKPTADARTQDMVQNDGYAYGAAALHRDNIVGSHYLLNATPNWRMLGVPEAWAEEFQLMVESIFNTYGESANNWFDAAEKNTFTDLIRLSVSSYVMTGEVLATSEWVDDDPLRPFSTAVQFISPARLSNPFDGMDTPTLRRGVEINPRGKALAYHIRMAHPAEYMDHNATQWKRVAATTKWGRRNVLHVMEQLLPSQNRGVAEMVAALKQMRMTKKFQEITLQSAVIQASYAASIESELPSGEVFAALGAGNAKGIIGGMNDYFGAYLTSLNDYLSGAKNVSLDGAKIPHFFPGTKMNVMPMGTPGGLGTNFEESLLRHIAACLGLSYEEFSRDYTKTNYSSARASMNNTWKSMQSKKRTIADSTANYIYVLFVEEMLSSGRLPLPPGKNKLWFYEPGVKDALCMCKWVGASRGQIDEMKETQAAVLRIASGLSTHEAESARLGKDFREVFAQLAREKKIMQQMGIELNLSTTKPKAEENSPAKSQGDDEDDEI